MKPFYLGTLLGVLSLACCGAPSQQVLRLEKSPLPLGGKMAVYMESNPHRPWNALYPVVRGVPDSWRDATVYYAETDLPQLLYQGYRQGLADEKFCMGYFNVWGLDTASRSARPIRSVIAMAAGVTAEGHPAYLFDTDGDDDLSDETVRYFGADSVAVEVTPVYVERYGGGGVVLPDLAYVYPACRNSDMLLYCAECCSGEAAVAGGRYAVTVKPYVRNYDADSAEIVFSDGDTTLRHRVGEFVRLGGSYYRIDSLRPDGRELRLTPTPDALDRPSAQVGFRPIPFEATTTDGRRVRFPEDFAGRYVLLDFWSLSCPPCLMDIRDHYLRDYAAYREAGFEILGVARNTDEDLRGNLPDLGIVWPVVADRPEGRITGCYRVDAYPTLYLIDPRGRIVAEGSDLRGERLSRWLRQAYPGVQPSPQTE